ncbi:MAG: hypothetical protein DRZ76_03775 [Candidatus Nealsonbacteria bacterium]|nr:MAG: hypothetical protein DRZ76_03775 [Candidatus Nealsonbacteria bacterium]
MKKGTLFLISFIIWFLLVWPFDPAAKSFQWQSIIVGILISFLVAILFGETFTESPHKFYGIKRYFWAFMYIPVFFWEMVKANFDVMYRVLHPAMPIKPGIVKVKTVLKSKSGITALCNSITLTPGTLTVDVTSDGYLYIHWINVKSKDVEKASQIIVGRFERILTKIFE